MIHVIEYCHFKLNAMVVFLISYPIQRLLKHWYRLFLIRLISHYTIWLLLFIFHVWSSFESFWKRVLFENINLGEHFLLWHFLIASICETLYFLKWYPICNYVIYKLQQFPNLLVFNPSLGNLTANFAILRNRYIFRLQMKNDWTWP